MTPVVDIAHPDSHYTCNETTRPLAICWGRRRWQRTRLTLGLKADAIVGAVTKRLVARVATTAKGDRLTPRDIELAPLGVFDHKLPRNAQWTIVSNSDSRTGHGCSPLALGYKVSNRPAYYTRFTQCTRIVPCTTGISGSITKRIWGKSVSTVVKLPMTVFTTVKPRQCQAVSSRCLSTGRPRSAWCKV